MRMINVLVLLIIIPFCASAGTLEELQRAALNNRALIKQFDAEVEKATESIRVAKSGYYPSLDLRYNTYTIDEATPTERRENSIFTTSLTWNTFC